MKYVLLISHIFNILHSCWKFHQTTDSGIVKCLRLTSSCSSSSFSSSSSTVMARLPDLSDACLLVFFFLCCTAS